MLYFELYENYIEHLLVAKHLKLCTFSAFSFQILKKLTRISQIHTNLIRVNL